MSSHSQSSESAVSGTSDRAATHKKMLLFINVFPHNWQVVKAEYGRRFDMRMWDGHHDSVSTLARLARNADRVYANTDVLTHPQDEKLRALAGSKYVRYTGSTSKIRRVLDNDIALSII